MFLHRHMKILVALALAVPASLAFAGNGQAQQVFTQQQIIRQLQLEPGVEVEQPKLRKKRAPRIMMRAPEAQNGNEEGEQGPVVLRRAPKPRGETLKSMRAPEAVEEVVIEEKLAPRQKKLAKSRAPGNNVAERRAPKLKNNLAKSRAPEAGQPQPSQLANIEPSAGKTVLRGIDVRETVAAAETADNYPDLGRIDLEILFEYDSDRIDPKSVKQLIVLGEALNDPQLGNGRFMIAGHTDAAGSDGYNADLSLRRANAVSRFLEEFAGVASQRLVIDGYGEELLKYPDAPESGQNRRVEIINLGEAG